MIYWPFRIRARLTICLNVTYVWLRNNVLRSKNNFHVRRHDFCSLYCLTLLFLHLLPVLYFISLIGNFENILCDYSSIEYCTFIDWTNIRLFSSSSSVPINRKIVSFFYEGCSGSLRNIVAFCLFMKISDWVFLT